MRAQVLRYTSYLSMPWRNGRGTTLEIAREPAIGEEFAWRLSLADIAEDGDFSAYPGYGRALTLVAGEKLHLRFRGHGQVFLSPTRRSTRFEGEWQTHCAIPQGRCTDLSLIVRKEPDARSGPVVRQPKVLHLDSTRELVLARNLYGALFVLSGSAAIAESGRGRNLHACDTLLLSPGSRRVLTLRRLGRSPAQLILLRWRPPAD